MFGYVTASLTSLTNDQLDTYRSYYCGLCSRISSIYGSINRIALTYDMTFLSLLLSSLYELEEHSEQCRCAVHPVKHHSEIYTQATDYAAALNVLLAYYKSLDDRHDDHSTIAVFSAMLLKQSALKASGLFPNKAEHIIHCLTQLREAEILNLQDPDHCAKLFGQLLGDIFVWRDDQWSDLLRQTGYFLGQYVYLADAIVDLPKDIKKKRYNPFSSRWDTFPKEDYLPVLKILMGECTSAFERLPLLRHTELLRNILYEGVWLRVYRDKSRVKKENCHVR